MRTTSKHNILLLIHVGPRAEMVSTDDRDRDNNAHDIIF